MDRYPELVESAHKGHLTAEIISWMRRKGGGGEPRSRPLGASLCAAIYEVWKERNARRLQNKTRSVVAIVRCVLFVVCTRICRNRDSVLSTLLRDDDELVYSMPGYGEVTGH